MITFNTEFDLNVDSLAAAIELVAEGVEQFEWPKVTGIDSPSKAVASKGKKSKESDIEAVLSSSSTWLKADSFRIFFGGESNSFLSMGFSDGTARGTVTLELAAGLFEDDRSYESSPRWLVKHLWSTGRLRKARTHVWGKDEIGCVPRVPIADVQDPLVLTSDQEIAQFYDDIQAFVSSWPHADRHGEQVLLERATNAVSQGDFMSAVREHQWHLARIAKPGLTKYQDPIVAPAIQDLFEKGEHALEMVGIDGDGIVEFSSAIEAGQHVPGFDIYFVREIVKKKKLRNGQAANGVRVVFMERDVAIAEKRPLLDVGARVFAMGANGDEEIT